MYCVPTIPAMKDSFATALTYSAQLCEIAKEVQRITEEVKKLSGVTAQYVQDYVNSQVAPIQTKLTTLTASVDARFAAQAALIQQRVDELKRYADTQSATVYSNATAYTDEAELLLSNKIETTLLQGGMVRSPLTGDVVSVQQALNELAGLHQDGITAEAFDALELTAHEFEAKDLTAYEFDYAGIPA